MPTILLSILDNCHILRGQKKTAVKDDCSRPTPLPVPISVAIRTNAIKMSSLIRGIDLTFLRSLANDATKVKPAKYLPPASI